MQTKQKADGLQNGGLTLRIGPDDEVGPLGWGKVEGLKAAEIAEAKGSQHREGKILGVVTPPILLAMITSGMV